MLNFWKSFAWHWKDFLHGHGYDRYARIASRSSDQNERDDAEMRMHRLAESAIKHNQRRPEPGRATSCGRVLAYVLHPELLPITGTATAAVILILVNL